MNKIKALFTYKVEKKYMIFCQYKIEALTILKWIQKRFSKKIVDI